MGKKTDDLLEEILKNYREDRKELVSLRKRLINNLDEDPGIGALAGISENVVKLTDVLSRMNAQAIELSKVNMKNETIADSNDTLPDKDSMYAEIEAAKDTEEDLN